MSGNGKSQSPTAHTETLHKRER